jgi:hypothetical protein
VQGPGWLVPGLEEKWANEDQREALLHVVRLLEKEPGAQAMTPHLMAVGRKGSGQ